jgi:hypothetical protein
VQVTGGTHFILTTLPDNLLQHERHLFPSFQQPRNISPRLRDEAHIGAMVFNRIPFIQHLISEAIRNPEPISGKNPGA